MALITWNDNLSVKVAELDRQHQRIILLINDLTDAIKRGRDKAITGQIVQSLIDYSKNHFQTEERYFEQFKYPQAARHIKEHDTFRQRVTHFESGNPQGEVSLSLQILQFLGDWLINHVMGTDKEYSAFFNAHGLK